MDKKERKSYNKKLMYELSLLLPSFAYMSHCLGRASNTTVIQKEEELTIESTRQIVKYLGAALLPYRELHMKAVEKNNAILKKIDTKDISTFLFGVSLLGVHIEIKKPIIESILLQEHILDIQDQVSSILEDKKVEKTYQVATDFNAALLKNIDPKGQIKERSSI